MAERRVTCRRGERLSIGGPATIRVNRRATLIIDAARETAVDRLPCREAETRASRETEECAPPAPRARNLDTPLCVCATTRADAPLGLTADHC
ncbi:MAG: hypothetical protein ACT4QC_16040 [Planctomycetaceae bacterium]